MALNIPDSLKGRWKDDKRAYDFFYILEKFKLISFEDRHVILQYWYDHRRKLHGSKTSITNKD